MTSELRWFPTDIDPAAATVELARVPAAALREAAFLDERWRVVGERVRRPFAQVIDRAHARRPAFVFHTAFCGSTLLARALDVPERAMVLREPGVLVKLANLKRERHPWSQDAARWRQLVGAVFGLLGDAAGGGERAAIKPSNVCNNLIGDAMALPASGPSLLLYSDLRSFLVSVLKKGEQGRGFVRRLCLSFSLDLPQVRDVPARELLLMTDLQVAAAVWLMQMELFAQALRGARRRVRTLNADRFLNEPKPVLVAASAFLELGLDAATIDAVVAGPVFRRNSKIEAQAYDVAQRREEGRAIEAAFGPELDRVVDAARQGWRGLKMPALPLANDLLGGA